MWKADHDLLSTAAEEALRAPSVFNTQPWRWRLDAGVLELRADWDRQLAVSDPQGHLLLLSCGAALHHARVSMAVLGRRAEVALLPDPAHPDILAHVRLGGHHTPDDAERAMHAAIALRRTDRRPFSDEPVPDGVFAALRTAAESEGVHLHRVRTEQVPLLAIAVARAEAAEIVDPAYRKELMRWTNRPPWSQDGVPPASAVRPTPRRVPVRELALPPEQGMPVEAGGDQGAAFAVLFGEGDEPRDWLRAGQATSAVLLTAVALGLTTAPISDVIEVESTRCLMGELLEHVGQPYLVLRLGYSDSDGELAPVPRRDPTEVIKGFSPW